MADNANSAPETTPMTVERLVLTWLAPGLSEMTMTPMVAMTIAAAVSGVTCRRGR